MVETAAFLVDYVIPHVPVRQWVTTFPPPLRYLLAYDSELQSRVIGITVKVIFSWQRWQAKRLLGLRSIKQAHPGAVTFIQRAGGAVNLNLHLHSAVFDGVYVEETPGRPPTFRAMPAPSDAEVAQIAWEVCQRTTKLLQARGRYFDADPGDADILAQEQPLLAACYAASLQGTVATGPHAGQHLLRLGTDPLVASQDGQSSGKESPQSSKPGHGFDIHARVRIPKDERKRLERLCRYMARPPLAQDRLSLSKEGRVIYQLKRPWSDGSRCVSFDPEDFLAKLVPLVPAPRVNQIRYHGMIAPAARLRSLVVPKPDRRRSGGASEQLGLFKKYSPNPVSHNVTATGRTTGSATPLRHRYTWAELLQRTFKVDAESCVRCGHGPMRLVGVVTDPAELEPLLESLGWPSARRVRPNPASGARASPQLTLPFVCGSKPDRPSA